MPQPNPQPPSPTEAARIVQAAWTADPQWGTFVWLAMTTGARRSELCALRWADVDLESQLIRIERSLYRDDEAQLREKDTKTHQHRRLVLEDDAVALLRAHQQRQAKQAEDLGAEAPTGGYVFSPDPEGLTPMNPATVTQRYRRLVSRLGINTTLKNLRHYSATELINAGVDMRTVAGRLGHGGGGATTLRVYTAWLSEADQRAAKTLSGRVPRAPAMAEAGVETPTVRQPGMAGTPPYEQIVTDLRGAISCGALTSGSELPPAAELAERYSVAASTAHRAIARLVEEGLVTASRGRRVTVV